MCLDVPSECSPLTPQNWCVKMLQKLKNQAAKNVLNPLLCPMWNRWFWTVTFCFLDLMCHLTAPKPVDRWEKETAAAQCVFSTLIWHNWVSLNWLRQFCYSYWVRHAKMAHSGKPTESNAIIFFFGHSLEMPSYLAHSRCRLFVDPYKISVHRCSVNGCEGKRWLNRTVFLEFHTFLVRHRICRQTLYHYCTQSLGDSILAFQPFIWSTLKPIYELKTKAFDTSWFGLSL